MPEILFLTSKSGAVRNVICKIKDAYEFEIVRMLFVIK